MKKWVKSSYTPPINQLCVEVALEKEVYVRDSKNRDGVQLCVSPAAWTSFIGSLPRHDH